MDFMGPALSMRSFKRLISVLVLLALVTGDSVVLRRLYPQWGLECRLPGLRGGQLYVLCSRDGLFVQPLPRWKPRHPLAEKGCGNAVFFR